jgi:hypothetical protein
MIDAEIVAEIRAAVQVANYELDLAKCSRHMGDEGFTIFEAERAVLGGEVIAAERGRWLFLAKWLHYGKMRDFTGAGFMFQRSTMRKRALCSSQCIVPICENGEQNECGGE